jgi:hypothetical protein
MDILVEGFSAFGIELQVWMPIAVLIIAAAVAIAAGTKQSSSAQTGHSQKMSHQ